MILVQTLGAGCAACDQLAANARLAVEQLGIDARVEQVGDIDVILSLEVLAVPALAIDGHVTANGRVPSVAEIKQMLTVYDAIAAEEQARSVRASGRRGREGSLADKTGEKVA